MFQHSLPASLFMLLLACEYASAIFLYASSNDGNVTVLNYNEKTDPHFQILSSTTDCGENPTWLTLDFGRSILYCVDEGLESRSGSLSAFRTTRNGTLHLLDKVETPSGPVHATIYGQSGNGLALAHYGASALTTWDVSDPHAITLVQTEKFTLSKPGADPKRQEAPHPHQAVLDPTKRFIIVPDTGADLIRVYAISLMSLTLEELKPVKVEPGSGPRHLAFAVIKKRTFMYLLNDLQQTIIGYKVSYHGDSIKLKKIFNIGYWGKDSWGLDWVTYEGAKAGEIAVTPNAGNLITSIQNTDTIWTPWNEDPEFISDHFIGFTIDPETGKLEQWSRPVGGKLPQQFSINKAGTKIAVAFLGGNHGVAVVDMDAATGHIHLHPAQAKELKHKITAVLFDE